MCERAALGSTAAHAVGEQCLALMWETAVHHSFFPLTSIAPQPARSITPPDATMSVPHLRNDQGDDEKFIDGLLQVIEVPLFVSWVALEPLMADEVPPIRCACRL